MDGIDAREAAAGKLTGSQIKRVLRAAMDVQTSEAFSDAHMGRLIGISRTTWSRLKAGKYRTPAEPAARIAAWMRDRLERREAPPTDFVKTEISRLILRVCTRAWQMPSIGQVITPSGAGKTMALVEFARVRGERAVLIQAGEAFRSQYGLLAEIARRLGLHVAARDRMPQLYHAVRERCAAWYAAGANPPVCLIVDEATTLRPGALNMLRNLHDDPDSRVALVLADTWRMDAELHQPRGRGMAGGYEQLRSRFGAVYQLPADRDISEADVRAVADSILAGLGFRRTLHRSSYRYLHKLAQLDGKLRNVAHRLHAVHDIADAAGGAAEYTVAQLDWAASLVGRRPEQTHEHVPFESSEETTDHRLQATESAA